MYIHIYIYPIYVYMYIYVSRTRKRWIQDPGSKRQHPGSRILASGSWIQHPAGRNSSLLTLC